jgi:DNA-binding response OmpR family regulator
MSMHLDTDNKPMGASNKVKVRGTEKIKVLVADNDGQAGRRLFEYLNVSGFETRMVSNGADVKKMITSWRPRVLLTDLLLPGANAFELLSWVQNEVSTKDDIAVIVMSGHNSDENIKEAYLRGARDYLARPIMYPDLLSRIVFHCRDVREINHEASSSALKLADIVITQTLQKLPFEEMLFNLTRMAALKMQGLRCSVIHQVTQERGIVIASSDRRDIAGYPLDLRKYPEVQLVVNSGKVIVIDDLGESKALSRIKSELKDINFNSMAVCPIYCRGKAFGVLSMRMPSATIKIKNTDVYFLEFLAKAMSLYLATQPLEDLGRYGLLTA